MEICGTIIRQIIKIEVFLMDYMQTLLILCPLVFLAGFVDAIAGGGGLIALPAYLFAGLPAHTAIGSNKLSSCSGLVAACYKYFKEKKVRLSVALYSALGCIVGAGCGTRLALFFPERTLRLIVLIAVPIVAVFLATRKDLGKDEQSDRPLSRKNEALISTAIGVAVGLYDGLIGPGAGTFLILGFTTFLGIGLVQASACAKVSNMASNLTSVVIYAISGNVQYLLAIPAAVCSILGGYTGAKVAVKGGGKRVKQFMYVVLALLFVKLVSDLFMG
ncbi:MAG: sulfite exporter TauE/SafE family protein, partial [Clostridia bacterium]|nr:sulfite exporter TauE/SafE family protein [Clostridia bacterium]